MIIILGDCEYPNCKAPAHWSVQLYELSEPMKFCVHHSNIVEPKILELAPYKIVDDRDAAKVSIKC